MKCFTALFVLLFAGSVMGQQIKPFADSVGNVPVGVVKAGVPVECPFMTWGGDLALLHSNGDSLVTQKGSTYEKMGANFKFYRENEFKNQVKDYLSGRTPFLRCTYSMLGQASEVLNKDPRTKPVVFLFISWSQGDHMISRQEIKSLNDLKRPAKKVRIALQEGGAHVGWLYDLLATVQINKEDVEMVWCKEMVGADSPPALFKKDPTIDACFAVTPDMMGLCGGTDKVGTGAEGSVKGSHVLVSTQQMSHAIPDVVSVRSDYYSANKASVEAMAAGYVKASEEIIAMRKDFETTKKLSPQYKALLTAMQTSFGKDVITDLENDGHGLLMDCVFGVLPLQISFFEDKGNLSGFEGQMKSALDMAQAWGFTKTRLGFNPSTLSWEKVASLAGVKYIVPDMTKPKVVAEAANLFPDSELDSRTIGSFTIHFEPAQEAFTADQYGADFQRALLAASQFSNAVIVVRGHADPTKTLVDFLRRGMAKGIITRTGTVGNFQYSIDGKPLDVTQTNAILALINSGRFDGAGGPQDPDSPRETMQAALNLSLSRSQAVKTAVVELAKKNGVRLDPSQIQPLGAGILEPVVAKPKNIAEAKQNMRVEFRIVKVAAESIKPSEFEY